MVIQTKTISEEKIKLRWNEPYVSEASDIQASVNSPGVYRGGFLKSISPSPNQFFRVTKDSDVDTALLHFNSSSGIATVMRLDSDELIDMSSEFPILADTVWYVYASVSYVSGSPTTASIEVSDVMPSGDEIMLGAIFMPAGALTILDSYVRTDGVYRKLPASRRGMIIPKSVKISALAGRTEFQITDRVYLYNNGSVTDMANSRVKLYDDLTDSFKPLVGSDGGQIRVSRVTSVTGGVVPIPFSSLDSDGCFSNPFVIMDFSDTVDTVYAGQFYANYWAYCELDEIPTGFAAEGNIFHGVHVQDVLTKTLTNSGTALPVSTVSSGFLGTVLETLFQFIRHKVDINQQPAVSPGWLPLWRSHGNSNVYEQIDIYWKDSSLAVVMNGSMDTAGNVSWRAAGHLRVFVFERTSWASMYRYASPAPSPVDITDPADWDVHDAGSINSSIDTATFRDVPVQRIFEKYVQAVVQDVTTSTGYTLLFHASALGLRVYIAGISINGGSLLITQNAYWDNSTSKWIADYYGTSPYHDANAIMISEAGFSMLFKDDTSSPWANADWDELNIHSGSGIEADASFYEYIASFVHTYSGAAEAVFLVTYKMPRSSAIGANVIFDIVDLLPSAGSTFDGVSITGATQDNPCVVTAVGHGMVNGDRCYIDNVSGMTELNGRNYTITKLTNDTFKLDGVDSSGYGEYTSGGEFYEIRSDLSTMNLDPAFGNRVFIRFGSTAERYGTVVLKAYVP